MDKMLPIVPNKNGWKKNHIVVSLGDGLFAPHILKLMYANVIAPLYVEYSNPDVFEATTDVTATKKHHIAFISN